MKTYSKKNIALILSRYSSLVSSKTLAKFTFKRCNQMLDYKLNPNAIGCFKEKDCSICPVPNYVLF